METRKGLFALLLGFSTVARAAFGPPDIDRMVAAEWKKAHLSPAAPSDDATFFRRVHLDLVGTIPERDAVEKFLADASPDKRAHAVDALLADPRSAEHFADYWESVLVPHAARVQVFDRDAFHGWLRQRFVENAPWDKLVVELLTATGVNSTGGKRNDPGREAREAADPTVNGAVDWLLLYRGAPEDLAGVVSRELLGVQIQCAQCHKHPTEKWTQTDFRRFAATFARMKATPLDAGKMGGIKRVSLADAPKALRGGPNAPQLGEVFGEKPAALDGTDLSTSTSPRQALAGWMTAPSNPWFARELVNRMWGYLVGRGFVEPIDDLRPSNETVMPALLDALAADFAAHKYDLHYLVRTICGSRVYQLSSGRIKGKDPEDHLFARHPLRPMGPEQLLDSVITATHLESALAALPPARAEAVKQQLHQSVGFLFDVDEEGAPPDFEGTVQQALALINGGLTTAASSALPGTTLARIADSTDDDAQRIATLYLSTLSRRPTAQELLKWTTFVNADRELVNAPKKAPPGPLRGKQARTGDPLAAPLANRLKIAPSSARMQAYEDLQWALLNSSEFVFRH
jgi:hypothetical protein